MVAYSFNTAFVPDIEARTKRQTIRLPRKRHARPGERVQLFTGMRNMRTKRCRKIIPDPLCVGVDEVRLDLRRASAEFGKIAGTARLELNGIPLIGLAADAYAAGEGFRSKTVRFKNGRSVCLTAFGMMAIWWWRMHGRCLFEGVAIRWSDAP